MCDLYASVSVIPLNSILPETRPTSRFVGNGFVVNNPNNHGAVIASDKLIFVSFPLWGWFLQSKLAFRAFRGHSDWRMMRLKWRGVAARGARRRNAGVLVHLMNFAMQVVRRSPDDFSGYPECSRARVPFRTLHLFCITLPDWCECVLSRYWERLTLPEPFPCHFSVSVLFVC